MPAHFHPPTSKRIGRLKGLAITLLGIVVLASAGVPTLAVAAASDLIASPAPSASPEPSASDAPAASPSPSPEPSASAVPDPSAPVSPYPSVALSPISTPSPMPPPGAVAAATLKGQPYQLPAFVGLGAWQASRVSFYGPGFYCVSNRVKACLPQRGRPARAKLTACGVLFTRTVVGVAHRTLPCGTLVAFTYRGRTVIAPVIDRGPYVAGRVWDLSGGLCVALRHCFTGPISWTIVHRAIGPAAPVRISLRRL
jgi:rare lipoprotein A (peptidoglycan hydrolase)